MTRASTARLTREAACEAFGIPPEVLAMIDRDGDLVDAGGTVDPLALAAAAIRFGLGRSEAAERKVQSVASALNEVRPALERLADLPARAGLAGENHDKVTIEVAAFFTAFADAMNRATRALAAEE